METPVEVVREVLGRGYFAAIDRGDAPAAVEHLLADVEMVFDPEADLRGREAVLEALTASLAGRSGMSHVIEDILAAELDGVVIGLGTLVTNGGSYRFAVAVRADRRQISHFLTQKLDSAGVRESR